MEAFEKRPYEVRVNLARGLQGVLLTVETDPRIEEFFSNLSGGISTALLEHACGWRSRDKENDLQVYANGPQEVNGIYGFNRLGYGLVLNDGSANLSFLQFKGIGNPGGVSIVLDKPPTEDIIKRFKLVTGTAVEAFLRTRILPVSMTVVVYGKEGR